VCKKNVFKPVANAGRKKTRHLHFTQSSVLLALLLSIGRPVTNPDEESLSGKRGESEEGKRRIKQANDRTKWEGNILFTTYNSN